MFNHSLFSQFRISFFDGINESFMLLDELPAVTGTMPLKQPKVSLDRGE